MNAGNNKLSIYQAMQNSLTDLEIERNTLALENAFLRGIVEAAIEAGQISPNVLKIGPHKSTPKE